MALSREELLLRARALGFSTATDEQGNATIFPKETTATESGEGRWLLALQQSSGAGASDRWLLIVQNSPQISFYPEDALRFLISRSQRSS